MDLGPKIETGGGSTFVKLGDGDSITGVFRGTPLKFKSEWVGSETRRYPENHPLGGFRFQLNMVEKDTWEAKVLEGGVMIYNQLVELQEEGYKLTDTWLKVKRNGTGTNTTYTVLPIKDAALTEEQTNKVESIKLNELKVKYNSTDDFTVPTDSFKQVQSNLTEADVPF